MGRVGDRADRLTQHVHHPVGGLAAGDQGVQRPCRRPHDVGARLVVFGIIDRDQRAVDDGLHQCLGKIIRGIVVVAREVLLTDVVEDVIDTRRHLSLGQREGELWVEDGELRHDIIAKDMADLELLLVVGDDGAAVHLGAGARHRQDAADRDDGAVGLLKADIVFVPRIVIAVDGDRYRLGVVAAGAAADRQQKIDVILSRKLYALAQLINGRVGHHARVLDDGFAVILEDLGHRVIDAVLLDRAAAVDQLYGLAVFGKLVVQILQRILSEIELCRVVITEIA